MAGGMFQDINTPRGNFNLDGNLAAMDNYTAKWIYYIFESRCANMDVGYATIIILAVIFSESEVHSALYAAICGTAAHPSTQFICRWPRHVAAGSGALGLDHHFVNEYAADQG